MASVVEITINSNIYSFDFATYIISVSMDKMVVPDLYDAIRQAEETALGMAYPYICKGEGLAVLDEDGADSVQTSLTVTLYNGWLITSTKTSGVFSIKSGNLVASPTGAVFGVNPLVTYIGFFSESGTISKVAIGSAVTPQDKIDIANFYYSLDGKTWTDIGEPLKMEYTLMEHFMGYRFGLFNYATKKSGGYVDFDWFRIN